MRNRIIDRFIEIDLPETYASRLTSFPFVFKNTFCNKTCAEIQYETITFWSGRVAFSDVFGLSFWEKRKTMKNPLVVQS